MEKGYRRTKMADAHIIWKEREVRLETYYNSGIYGKVNRFIS